MTDSRQMLNDYEEHARKAASENRYIDAAEQLEAAARLVEKIGNECRDSYLETARRCRERAADLRHAVGLLSDMVKPKPEQAK